MLRIAVRRLAATLIALPIAACWGSPTDVALDMDTERIDRATAERAIDAFRDACRPLFSTHAADVRAIHASASDEGSTAIRRLGWVVHIDLVVEVKTARSTLPASDETTARYLIGGGDRPGFAALSPLAAALCDRPPAPGAKPVFVSVPSLTALLPATRPNPSSEQRNWYAGELKRALEGEYQGQRNIAWCYIDGCDGVEPIDDVSACAWRLVIAAAKHPKGDASDAANVTNDCKVALSPTEQSSARAKAEDLFLKIYKSPLPK